MYIVYIYRISPIRSNLYIIKLKHHIAKVYIRNSLYTRNNFNALKVRHIGRVVYIIKIVVHFDPCISHKRTLVQLCKSNVRIVRQLDLCITQRLYSVHNSEALIIRVCLAVTVNV